MAGGFDIEVVHRAEDRALDVYIRDGVGHHITFDGHSPDFAALSSPVRRPAVTIGAGLGPRVADVLREIAARLDALLEPVVAPAPAAAGLAVAADPTSVAVTTALVPVAPVP